MNWSKLRIAIIGGDEREREIARLAAATGAEVRAYGFPWPMEGIIDVEYCNDAASAMYNAHYALFPIPGLDSKGALFAPSTPELIVPDKVLLGQLASGANVLLGRADDHLRAACAIAGVTLHEYEADQELMLLRAPAIIEGALKVAIENTEVTIHAAEVCVVGYGNLGTLLARTLSGLGANVHVAARSPVQRAAAHAVGAHTLELGALGEIAPSLAMVFSTVPAPVVGKERLERLPPATLVMDLAAPPGGVDLEYARALGHRVPWARGLGRRAPVTVGGIQWHGIRKRIEHIEGRKDKNVSEYQVR